MRKKPERGWIVKALALTVVVAAHVAAVPEFARPQDSSEGAPAEEGLRPQSIAGFQTRDYRIRPKKLWKALLRKLEERGYPPEDVDKQARIVKTSFVDFEAKDFDGEVGEEFPNFGPNQPIVTMLKPRFGKVSLEVRVAKSDAGAELKVRARILVDGMDRKKMVRVLVDVRSSGIIESDLIERLETTLGIEPI
ncbi:MAG: hypothetical protein O7A63_01775 [Acidobacteria bacterium]|nr:hypothetical protein [Acidobacteriota bacterium]